jgi:hypothetical protein
MSELDAALSRLESRILALEFVCGTRPIVVGDGVASADDDKADAMESEKVRQASAKIRRRVTDDPEASMSRSKEHDPEAEQAVRDAKRSFQDRVDTVVSAVAAAPCAQALRDVNRLLGKLRPVLDLGGLDAGPTAVDLTDAEAASHAAAISSLLPDLREFADRVTRLEAAEFVLDTAVLQFWATGIVAADADHPPTATIAEATAAVATSEKTDPLAGPLVIATSELQLALRNAERAVALLERFSEVQSKQVRLAAFVSDALHQRHRALSAREARVAAFNRPDGDV